MDNKVLFDFNIRPKSKPGPKKIVVTKRDIKTNRTDRRQFENSIVISPFEVCENYNHAPNYDYTNVNDDYCFINTRVLEPILPNMSKTALRTIWHFMYLLQPNSNCLSFSIYMVDQIHGNVRSGDIYKELTRMEDYGFIRRTNLRSIFIINHNLFFKGNLNEFAKKYHEKFDNNTPAFNERGYVILDTNSYLEVKGRTGHDTLPLRGMSEEEIQQERLKLQMM